MDTDAATLDRIQQLIRDPWEHFEAGEEELTDLCARHRPAFAREYMTIWADACDQERLFRRTSEQWADLRIDPSRFELLCIHDLGTMPADSLAWFRFMWIASQQSGGTWLTEPEHLWLEVNTDRMIARGGTTTDLETIKTRHTYCGIGLGYAEGVVSGEIPACRWIRLACQRQIDDLKGQEPAPQAAPEPSNVVKMEPKS